MNINLLKKWMYDICYSNFFSYTMYVKELKIDLSSDYDVEKYRIVYSPKEGGYYIWYKFNKKDKYKLLTWDNGKRFSFFDGSHEEDIAQFLSQTDKEDLFGAINTPDPTGELVVDLLISLNQSVVRFEFPKRSITKVKFGICKYETYFKKLHEQQECEMIEEEFSRLMEKND